jgi:hypothetical protein
MNVWWVLGSNRQLVLAMFMLKLNYDRRSVGCLCWCRAPIWAHHQIFFLSHDVERPLWREDGSVIYSYNYFWNLPAQSLSGPSPAELLTVFYCLIWDFLHLEGQGPRNRVANLYFRALVPFSSPLTTRRNIISWSWSSSCGWQSLDQFVWVSGLPLGPLTRFYIALLYSSDSYFILLSKAPSLTRKRVCSLQCNHSLIRLLMPNNHTLSPHLRLCSLFVASYDSPLFQIAFIYK